MHKCRMNDFEKTLLLYLCDIYYIFYILTTNEDNHKTKGLIFILLIDWNTNIVKSMWLYDIKHGWTKFVSSEKKKMSGSTVTGFPGQKSLVSTISSGEMCPIMATRLCHRPVPPPSRSLSWRGLAKAQCLQLANQTTDPTPDKTTQFPLFILRNPR